MRKLRVAVIFGGRSGEHEVSLRSAASIIRAMDRNKYDIIPIAITKEGRWLSPAESEKLLPQEVLTAPTDSVALLADPVEQSLVRFDGECRILKRERVDVVFPVLHGPYGEDGTIQGLFEMANIAYVGSGVLASAVGMDKHVMKRLFREAGLPVVRFIAFLRTEWEENPRRLCRRVLDEIGLPCFVKPANLGSSVGVTKVKAKDHLAEAIDLAAAYDRKIMVEEAITCREIEVSVLGNDHPIASLPGEIIPGAEFYDYADKYLNDAAQLIVPARLPQRVIRRFQQLAIRAFQTIDAAGLARVDFFLERGTNRIIINEINTMPGFTEISMYPKLWEVSGIPFPQLVDRLIELALERHREKSRSRTSYEPPR
ncbi:MAG TPA: D-alanine--D-alanine ligase family protein [Blastocatellia bacterium]|nr:D-alanine--D-alanine ligase family protein [Blastocatellia bacterium]